MMCEVISYIFNSFFKDQRKKSLAASSPGIPITITSTNHKLTTSMKATKANPDQVVRRGKPATKLEEVRDTKETQIVRK